MDSSKSVFKRLNGELANIPLGLDTFDTVVEMGIACARASDFDTEQYVADLKEQHRRLEAYCGKESIDFNIDEVMTKRIREGFRKRFNNNQARSLLLL